MQHPEQTVYPVRPDKRGCNMTGVFWPVQIPAHLCHGHLHRTRLKRIFFLLYFNENFWLKITFRQDELLSWKKLLGDRSRFPCP